MGLRTQPKHGNWTWLGYGLSSFRAMLRAVESAPNCAQVEESIVGLTQAHEVVDSNLTGCRLLGIAARPIPDRSKGDPHLSSLRRVWVSFDPRTLPARSDEYNVCSN